MGLSQLLSFMCTVSPRRLLWLGWMLTVYTDATAAVQSTSNGLIYLVGDGLDAASVRALSIKTQLPLWHVS